MLGTIHTRDEAIAAIDGALARWADLARGLWAQATARLGAIQSQVDAEIRERLVRVSALEAALSAASEEDQAAILAQLERAQRALDSGRIAQAEVSRLREGLQAELRRAESIASSLVPAARSDLRRRLASLGEYRVATPASGAPAADGETAPSTGCPSRQGIVDLSLADVDYSDNPIVGAFGKGGASRADYRWATETWATVVEPGIQRGLTRDDFARRDAERGAPPLRRTADVFDLFLGDTDQIAVSRNGDGRFNVLNGRHRIEVARQLGIQSLPGRIVE